MFNCNYKSSKFFLHFHPSSDMDVKFEFDKDQLAGKRAVVDVSGTKQASKQLVITYNANIEKCTKETIYVQVN